MDLLWKLKRTFFFNLVDANTDDIIKFHWNEDKPIKLPQNLEIAQFDLLETHPTERNFEYSTGDHSSISNFF